MSILRGLFEFNVPRNELINIYVLYIRSVAEFSSVVWSSSLTEEDSIAIERIQKIALRIILKEEYTTYENALALMKLPSLKERREKLSLNFALKCTQNDKTVDMFPLAERTICTRNKEIYDVTFARTDLLKNSAIPHMQRQLNEHLLNSRIK